MSQVTDAIGNRVTVFDTTLRDGEQSPGASMDLEEKLTVARALSELGVDVIEAGFAAASPGDHAAVQAVARAVRGPVIASLARCHKGDIESAWSAIRDAERPRLHVFVATSPTHRTKKLRMTPRQVIACAVDGISRARELTADVEFSAEDAARTERAFLTEVIERAIAAGATTINIPDTVGYAIPSQFAEVIRHLRAHVARIDTVTLSVHCHNDLGLAVANSLAALEAGARQVECTINGIGERAGNCSLEELVMALRTRADYFDLETGIRTPRLYPTSRLVSAITGLAVQRNKAVVGQNAFAHEAGIHQHGMLMHRSTYEIMRPEDVGFPASQMVLGKHSGRHALAKRLEELGFDLDEVRFDAFFADFKRLADKKKEVFDADLEALATGGTRGSSGGFELVSLHTTAGTNAIPAAAIEMRVPDGALVRAAALGDGPVDAVFKAIEQVMGISARLRDYTVRAVTIGEDAQGEALIEVEAGGRPVRARAVSTDIIEASARAFVRALNQVAADRSAAPEALAEAAR
jgi:2-isopropylmalate synthase